LTTTGFIFSALVKFLGLLMVSQLLFIANIIPAIILKAMGIMQLWTALLGALLAYGMMKTRLNEKN
jgi:cell division protein FtsW (lipid II flippase)